MIGGKGKTHFVGIGIEKYKARGYTSLNYPISDVNSFHEEIFREFYLGEDKKPIDPHFLWNGRATKKAIAAYLSSLKKEIKKEREENLIIYFAGHGDFDETFKTPSWALIDENLTYTELIGGLADIEALHILVISDACFSSRVGDLSFKSHINLSDWAKEHGATRYFLSSGRNEVPDKSIFLEEMLKTFYDAEQSISISDLSRQIEKKIKNREADVGLFPAYKSITLNEYPNLYFNRKGQYVKPSDLLETAKKEAITTLNEKKIEDSLKEHPSISRDETLLLQAKTYIKDIKTWRGLLDNESELYTIGIEDYLSNFHPALFRREAKLEKKHLETKERESYISLLKNTSLELIEEAKKLGPRSEIRKELIRNTKSLLNEANQLQTFITELQNERWDKEINDEYKKIIWLLGRLNPYSEDIDDFLTIELEGEQRLIVYCESIPCGVFKQFIDLKRPYPEQYTKINALDDQTTLFPSTWPDVLEFCDWLSIRKGYEPIYGTQSDKRGYFPENNGFRLPSIDELRIAKNADSAHWESDLEKLEWCNDFVHDEIVEEHDSTEDQESKRNSGRKTIEDSEQNAKELKKATIHFPDNGDGEVNYFSREEEITASFRLVRKVS